ncbi:MAG: mitofilin family membrane protein [Pseudomonadota bacterium]
MSKEKEPEGVEPEQPAKPLSPSDDSSVETAAQAEQDSDGADVPLNSDDLPAHAEPAERAEPIETEEPKEGSDDDADAKQVETAPIGPSSPPPQREIPAEYDHEHEGGGSHLASTALMILLLVLFVIGITLWAGPKLAPHLPESVAKYLNPALNGTKDRVAALENRLMELEGRAAPVLKSDLNEVKSSVDEALAAVGATQKNVDEVSQGAGDEIQRIDSAVSKTEAKMSNLDARVGQVETDFEKKVADLSGQLKSISTALAAAAEKDAASGPVNAQFQASLQALQSRVDNLAKELDTLPGLVSRDELASYATKADLAALASKADLEAAKTALSKQVSDAVAAADAAKKIGDDALNDARNSLKAAAVKGLTSTLKSRMNGGLPYDATLSELENLGAAKPPAAIASGAQTGLATVAELKSGFAAAARSATATESAAAGQGDTASLITSWLESQVSARPTTAVEGNSTGAVLSRVEAALNSADLAGALKEAETLPDAAKGAMSDWLDRLKQRVDADAALGGFVAQIGGQG